MKNVAVAIFIGLIILVLGLYLFTFQVREINCVLETTFGEPTRTITKPGWYFKWPVPIQRIHTYDARMRVFEGDIGETTTKGAVPIIVKTYVVWRIADPLRFYNAVGTINDAEEKLLSQLNDTQNKVIGRHYFAEFVNSDPDKIKFASIEEEMFNELQQALTDSYGIEIKELGIKQLQVSEDVSKDVFARMRAERNRKTQATISQGKAQANKIISDADAKKTELLAAAQARAKAIKGQGDAKAAQYYKMLTEQPELAMFLRDIEALKKILEKRSTVVIGADTDPFKLLREMPKIEPAKKAR